MHEERAASEGGSGKEDAVSGGDPQNEDYMGDVQEIGEDRGAAEKPHLKKRDHKSKLKAQRLGQEGRPAYSAERPAE